MDVCSPLYQAQSIKQLFLALRHAVKGLEIMAKSCIHRDISPGNILLIGDQGKLTDLEYAIRMGSGGKHNIRTGTIDFMSVEIEAGEYLIGHTGDIPFPPDLIHNYIHDLESIWWIGIWFLAWRCPEQYHDKIPQSILKQQSFAEKLFSHTSSDTRAYFFEAESRFSALHKYLSTQFNGYRDVLSQMRTLLVNRYKAHLADHIVHEEVFAGIHSEFGLKLDAALELTDLKLYFITSGKRPRFPTTANDERQHPEMSKRRKQAALDKK